MQNLNFKIQMLAGKKLDFIFQLQIRKNLTLVVISFSTSIKSYYSKGLIHTNLKLDSPKTVTFKMMGVGVYAQFEGVKCTNRESIIMTLSVSTRCRYISGMNVGRSISIKLDTSSFKINPPLLYQTQFHSFGLEEGWCFSRTCYNSTMLSRYTLGMLQIFRGSFLGIGTSGPNLCILVMLITRPVYISKSYWVVLSGNKKPI